MNFLRICADETRLCSDLAEKEDMRTERYDTFEAALVEVYGKNANFKSIMRNLSKTGAMFQVSGSDNSPQKGDFLRITVQLETVERTHTINGEVIWEAGSEFGVSFLTDNQLFDRMMQK